MRITDNNGLCEQIGRNDVRCEYYGKVFDNFLAVRSKFLFTIKSFGSRSSEIAEAFQRTGGGYLMLFGLLDKKLMRHTGIKKPHLPYSRLNTTAEPCVYGVRVVLCPRMNATMRLSRKR